MTINFEIKNESLFIDLPVEVDIDGYELRDLLNTHINDVDFIVANLSSTDYIGTPVLAGLLSAHIKLSRRGGEVIIYGLSEKILTLLKITRLDTLFKILDTEKEVLEYIENK